MINYIDFEISPIDEVVDAVLEIFDEWIFPEEAKDSYVIDLENQLSSFLEDELNEDLYCLIEYPYVDKLYRDSFYSYFSSKHYSYKRDCIRISVFEDEIKPEMFSNHISHVDLQKKYLGNFILRPLKSSLIGRAHISPTAFGKNCQICSFESTSVILGLKFSIQGFPHCSQDSETISCAETTIWSLMEYFGNKYAEYKPTLPSKINATLKSLSFQRQLPSNGLTINQISFALKEFGFGTRIYARDYVDDFENTIYHYIESGIPVVLGLETLNYNHATIAIGRNSKLKPIDKLTKREEIIIDGASISFIDFASKVDKLIIQDDNLNPYAELSFNNIGEFYEAGSEERTYEVKFLIVPLYPKIYLESTVAKKLILQFIADDSLGFKFEKEFVLRIFLASSRSFKSHISTLSGLNKDVKLEILTTRMPKFIWCAETYYEKEKINNGVFAESLLILDATEANHSSIDSLIFAGYQDRCIFLNNNKFVTLAQSLVGYEYYSNLN